MESFLEQLLLHNGAYFIIGFTDLHFYSVYKTNGNSPILNVATLINSIQSDELRSSMLESVKKTSEQDYKAIQELIKPVNRPLVGPADFFRKLT